MEITYSINEPLTRDQFTSILRRSTLSERRPIEDLDCIDGMLKQASLIVSAWHGALLVGIARSVTDFHYCCYLSDLAVDLEYQNLKIGIELQRQTQRQLGAHCKIILLAAPAASSYYPHIGYEKHENCWIVDSVKTLGS